MSIRLITLSTNKTQSTFFFNKYLYKPKKKLLKIIKKIQIEKKNPTICRVQVLKKGYLNL